MNGTTRPGGRTARTGATRDRDPFKETNVGGTGASGRHAGNSSRSKAPGDADSGAAGWEKALNMAKDRAKMAEKRAEMAHERAGDLERSLRDSVIHVEWLEGELATSRRRGGGDSSSASATTAAAMTELTERLRRAELTAAKRTHALEERLSAANDRAARAETRCAEAEARADKASREAKRAKDDGSAGDADPNHPKGSDAAKLAAMRKKLVEVGAAKVELQAELDAVVAFIVRKHGLSYGDINEVEDRYRGFLGHDRSPELFGKCSYLHGDVYVGEWSGGQPHGYGKCMFKDGKVYEGEWKTVGRGRGRLEGGVNSL